MPVVTIDLVRDIAISTKEQKIQLVKEITDTVANITKLPKESIYVIIRVNEQENTAVDGKLLSETQQ